MHTAHRRQLALIGDLYAAGAPARARAVFGPLAPASTVRCLELFGRPEPVELVRRLRDDAPHLDERLEAADLAGGAEQVGALLGASPGPAVTLIGGYRPVAFADEVRGRWTAFFCLERMPDPVAARATAAHEFAHTAHCALRAGAWDEYNVAEGVVMEAVAVGCARAVVPEATDEQLLMLDDLDASMTVWRSQSARVRARLAELATSADPDAFREVFYPAWGRPPGCTLPQGAGYLLARELSVLWGERLAEVACWDARTARQQVADALS